MIWNSPVGIYERQQLCINNFIISDILSNIINFFALLQHYTLKDYFTVVFLFHSCLVFTVVCNVLSIQKVGFSICFQYRHKMAMYRSGPNFVGQLTRPPGRLMSIFWNFINLSMFTEKSAKFWVLQLRRKYGCKVPRRPISKSNTRQSL